MTARYRGGYYGVRNADLFPPAFMKRLQRCSTFADLTAGSGQFPYRVMRELEMPVALNDRCYYAHTLVRAVHMGEAIDASGWALPKPLRGVIGYLADASFFKGNRAMRGWLDALCAEAEPALHAAIGKVILQLMTFRMMTWSNITPQKDPVRRLTPKMLKPRVERALERLAGFADALPANVRRQSHAYNTDAAVVLRRKPAWLKGACVYVDPAWPWAEDVAGGNQNPYRLMTYDLSSILLQEQVRPFTGFWTRKHGEDAIMAEVASWIEAAFAGGARTFVLCNQDTNFPSPAAGVAWLRRHRKLKPATIIRLDDHSSAANRAYKTEWAFYEA